MALESCMLTVVILNWRRPTNIQHICSALRRQNVSIHIVVWSNQSLIDSGWDCDEVIYSSENFVCWPRWFLGAQVTTRFVMVLDDDLIPNHPSAILSLLASAERFYDQNIIIGLEGVRLAHQSPFFQRSNVLYRSNSEQPNDSSAHFHYRYIVEPVWVDIIKGRLMLMKPSCLLDLPMAPRHYKWADDIVVSAHVAKHRVAPHFIPQIPPRYFADLPHMNGDMALSGNEHVRVECERCREYYFDYV